MDVSCQCMLPCNKMGLRVFVFWRCCLPLRTIFIFSHFDSVPVDSSWCHGWIVWRLRAIALIQCVERLSAGDAKLQHGNLEGNPYTKRVC